MLVFALLLLILPSVIATDITVKTYANRDVQINVIDPSSQDSIVSFDNLTESGIITASLSIGLGTVDLVVIIRDNGRIETMKKFTGYATGSAITLDMTAPKPAPVLLNATPPTQNNQNTSIQNTTTEIVIPAPDENKTDANKSASGFAVFQNIGEKINMTVVYYVFGIIAVLAVILFIYRYRGSFGKFFKKKEVDYFSKVKTMRLSDSGSEDRRLREAENKLRVVQEEIEKIKRIRGAEKRVEEAKRDLDRLRR